MITTTIDQFVGSLQGSAKRLVRQGIGISLNEIAAFLVAIILFALMFKTLPDAKMRWKDLWGRVRYHRLAVCSGQVVDRLYLKNSTWEQAGAMLLPQLIAALVWVYYSSLIVLFGAELTQVWTTRFGSGIEPRRGAVRMRKRSTRCASRLHDSYLSVWRELAAGPCQTGHSTVGGWVVQVSNTRSLAASRPGAVCAAPVDSPSGTLRLFKSLMIINASMGVTNPSH